MDLTKIKIPWWLHPRAMLIGIAIAMGATVVVAHGALVLTQIGKRWIAPFMGLGAPVVKVSLAVKKTVPVTLSYIGNTVAPRQVEIRARVEGWLSERYFVEGDDVNEGDLMYVIDERPFKAKLDQARAQLAKDEAAASFAKEQVERYGKLVTKEYVTRELYDQYVTTMGQADAAVAADRASVEQAELNLGYCRMYALVSGRVGRTQVDVGNLVGQSGSNNILTTIVPLDPIYVYFSPNEKEFLQIAGARSSGEIPVTLTFQDGTPYQHDGSLEFIDNAVNQQTSTVAMRAIIPNPEKKLLPGIYVNAKLIVAQAPNTILVPQTAIAETQQGFVAYVVNAKDRVEVRPVELASISDGMQAVTKGISDGERVIVEGLQKVKDG
ncbi:MAG TPA: efflux RND transporter periplasmic adaptor subunit, partial [bacterium]|nr:efflux RND transporter periplasmic adaptor subunit [bacterium]